MHKKCLNTHNFRDSFLSRHSKVNFSDHVQCLPGSHTKNASLSCFSRLFLCDQYTLLLQTSSPSEVGVSHFVHCIEWFFSFFFFQLNISSTYPFFCLLLTRLRMKNDKKYPCNFLSAFFDLSGSALLKAKNAAISYFYIYQKSYNHCLTESRSIHHACEMTNSD